MFVRQSIIICIILFSAGCSNYPSLHDDDIIQGDIVELNNYMEDEFEKGNLASISELYHKDAILLTPNTVISGKEDIDSYWLGIENPVKWNLEVIEVTQDEEVIYDNEYYKALKNKPPGWRENGIELDDDTPKVYQLGRSELTTIGEDGKEHTSKVDFILVWEVQPDASYKILLDTYTWQ